MGKRAKKVPGLMVLRAIRGAREELRRRNKPPVEQEAPPVVDEAEELTAIFAEIKSAKKKKAQAEAQRRAEAANKPKQRRFTEDGLPIYTEEELQMNNPKAGTTPLCPFDCDCCH